MLIVGTSVVAGKLITTTMPIFLSSFLSLVVASLLFLPTVYPVIKGKTLTKRDYWYLSLQALLGTVLYRIFFFFGLRYVNAGYTGILSALQPAMISILALIYLKEKPSFRQKAGVLLAVCGLMIVYVANGDATGTSPNIFLGTVLILLAVFGEACFSIFAKKVDAKVSPTTVAGVVTILSCIMMLPLALIDLISPSLPPLTITGLGLILYYGVFLTYISFVLWFKGLSQVSASVAGVFTALVPVSGVILSVIILREMPSCFDLIGGLLIIASLVLVVYKKAR